MPGGDQGGNSTGSEQELRNLIDYYLAARIEAGDDPDKIAFLLRGMLVQIICLADCLLDVDLTNNATSVRLNAVQIKAIVNLALDFSRSTQVQMDQQLGDARGGISPPKLA
ncbi:MAG: hypothetical protein FJX15_09715 [Alphaproteobacteria bacterium]|nr:hypothetical protein [Alphaproteobacteria bacterium]